MNGFPPMALAILRLALRRPPDRDNVVSANCPVEYKLTDRIKFAENQVALKKYRYLFHLLYGGMRPGAFRIRPTLLEASTRLLPVPRKSEPWLKPVATAFGLASHADSRRHFPC